MNVILLEKCSDLSFCHPLRSALLCCTFMSHAIPSQTVPYPGVRHAMIRPAVIHRNQCFWVRCSGLISAASTTAAAAAAVFAAACKGTLDEFLGPYHGP